MPVSTRLIKGRIKSIKSTKKITKAMELVAASKMRRAVESALGTRTYAGMARDLLAHLSNKRLQKTHPLLKERKEGSVLMIVVTSKGGFCGALNTNVLKKTGQFIAKSSNPDINFILVGKKGDKFALRSGLKTVATFPALPDRLSVADILPISKIVLQEFSKGTYSKVIVVYTDFVSTLVQKTGIRQVLPLTQADVEAFLQGVSGGDLPKKETHFQDYVFEPSPEKVLDIVLPRLVEVQVYQALLESLASEHSARMMAMRSASDAAGELIDDLTFSFNQARQAGITRELAEVTAGAAALED